MRKISTVLSLLTLLTFPNVAATQAQLAADVVDIIISKEAQSDSQKKKLACALTKSVKRLKNGEGILAHLQSRYNANKCPLFNMSEGKGKKVLSCATQLSQYFKGVTGSSRSKDGIQGVYFLQDQNKDFDYVLKIEDFEGAAYETLVSNTLYRHYGFEAPLTEVVEEGGACPAATVQLMEKYLSPDLLIKFKEQVENGHRFIFMSKAEGTAFLNLPDPKKVELLKDVGFIRELGKLYMLDVFLGNGDRLWKTLNMGNLFVTADQKFVTIDNAFKVHRQHDLETALSLVDGLDSNIAYQYATSTLKRFEKYPGVSFGIEKDKEQENTFVKAFLDGIKQQRDSIVLATKSADFKKMLKKDSSLKNLEKLSQRLEIWQKGASST